MSTYFSQTKNIWFVSSFQLKSLITCES